MVKITTALFILISTLTLRAATNTIPAKPLPDAQIERVTPYAAGTTALAGFASYRASEMDQLDGRFGGGAEVSYFLKNNIAVALEGLTENVGHAAIDEAGLHFKGYVPLGQSGFAPYGLLGVSHSFEGASFTQTTYDKKNGGATTTTVIRDGDWRMNAGAGLEFRHKRVALFGDGRWTHDFDHLGHFLFRTGASLSF